MSTVSLSLNQSTQNVTVSTLALDDSWTRIKRIFTGDGEHVLFIRESKFEIPLWLFLARREALAYRLDAEHVDPQIDDELEHVLKKTIKSSNEYDSAAARKAVSHSELTARLRRAGFLRHLKSYQSRNIRELLKHSVGATFSVPGAGKTTEALAYFLASSSKREHLLVIAPKNAFSAWETQLELCCPKTNHRFRRLVGGRGEIIRALASRPRFAIISYRQLQTVLPDVLSFVGKNPVAVFLDESHRMKGGLSRETGRSVLRLAALPTRKLLLSGTPMPNAPIDLVAQAQFLFPFKKVDESNAQSIISPIYVRTTKGELGLRKPDRLIRKIDMSPAQQRLYGLIAHEEARRLSGFGLRDKIQLRALGQSVIRLIQAASNPILLFNSTSVPREIQVALIDEGDSAKLAYAIERTRSLAKKGKKIVIWSTFIKTIESLASRLQDLGADYIHGGVDAGSEFDEDTRERKIRDFHLDDEKYVLIANPASCGEGISLHEVCHHAIYIDRNFNAGQYLQSEDRIHRLGLSKNQRTVIEILTSPATIDESVRARLNTKVGAMARSLNDHNLDIDPVSLDPETLSDDEALDESDAQAIIEHLKSYA